MRLDDCIGSRGASYVVLCLVCHIACLKWLATKLNGTCFSSSLLGRVLVFMSGSFVSSVIAGSTADVMVCNGLSTKHASF